MNARLMQAMQEARERATETEAVLVEAETRAHNTRVLDRFSKAQVAALQAALDDENALAKKAEAESLSKIVEDRVDDCLVAEANARKALAGIRAVLKARKKELLEAEKVKAETEKAKTETEAIVNKANQALSEVKAEAEEIMRAEAEEARKAEETRKAQAEAQRQAEEEAQRKAREEAERKAREEAQLKARQETDRKATEEAQFKALQDKIEEAKKSLSFIDKARGFVICLNCGEKVKKGEFCEECGGVL